MNNPEKFFNEENQSPEEVAKLNQSHFERRLASITQKDCKNLGKWNKETNEELGFRIHQKVGVVNDMINAEGKEIRIIVVFLRIDILNKEDTLSPAAEKEIEEIRKTFLQSEIQPIMMDSILNMDNKYIGRKNHLEVVTVKVPNPKEKKLVKQENLKKITETGFSLYAMLSPGMQPMSRDEFERTGKWEEEEHEEFILKKRVEEQKDMMGVYVFMHVYPLSTKKQLSEEAFSRLVELMEAFNKTIAMKYPGRVILPMPTPSWMLKE